MPRGDSMAVRAVRVVRLMGKPLYFLTSAFLRRSFFSFEVVVKNVGKQDNIPMK